MNIVIESVTESLSVFQQPFPMLLYSAIISHISFHTNKPFSLKERLCKFFGSLHWVQFLHSGIVIYLWRSLKHKFIHLSLCLSLICFFFFSLESKTAEWRVSFIFTMFTVYTSTQAFFNGKTIIALCIIFLWVSGIIYKYS